MTVPLSYYGSPVPPPERRELRAGPLTAVYEVGDLRYVKVGGVEVCRRWYAAVRDRNWGTVPGVISDEVIEQTADGFRVTYTSTHRQGDIHFVWRAEIIGRQSEAASSFSVIPAAEVVFRSDGEARATFQRNRIGQCVLHPRSCAGLPVWIHHADGTLSTGLQFPDLIAPDNPFRDVRVIHPQSSHQAWWTFEDDMFETEDQRNWIDASFKTFCTPLRLPFPVTVNAGDRVRQTVKMSMIGGYGGAPAPSTLRVTDELPTRLPRIGLSLDEDTTPLTERETHQLQLLRPAHFRVELDLTEENFAERLRQSPSVPLELAVTVSDDVWSESKRLIDALHAGQPPLARVLVFHNREWSTPERIIVPVVEAVARYDATVPVFVGTTANFTELNRGRPSVEFADGVCYSVQPQEHAFDNASLVECCATIGDTVRSARQFCEGKPIAVTPVTLRKRVNPYATGPSPAVPPDELPPSVDPRQMSLFGAAWTLGALKYLAESGVASATFYETIGWRGVMERESGCSLPDKFLSKPGMVFPLFHVLADANELAGADVIPCESPDPLRYEALFLQSGSRVRLLLANMTASPQTVTAPWPRSQALVRTLDETTVDFATSDPVAFRNQSGEPHSSENGRLTLSLKPYAYVRLDA